MKVWASLPVAWLLLALACAQRCPASAAQQEPQLYTYEVVAEYPHDANAFTQGRVCLAWLLCRCVRLRRRAAAAALAARSPPLTPPTPRCLSLLHTYTPPPGLEFDDVCDDDGENCRDIFWESTGAFFCAWRAACAPRFLCVRALHLFRRARLLLALTTHH